MASHALAGLGVLLLVAAAAAAAAPPPTGGWSTGRITYYGAPQSVAAAYDPSRGNGSFGLLSYGSCGYTNSDGQIAFPRDQPAAAADASPDFPGSCGRCYEIRCTSGPILNNQGQPIKIVNGYFEGDRFRPYLAAINANVTDTRGRAWPGNPAAARGGQVTQCWDEGKTIRVRITDSCPCTQVLKEGAPGVAKGGETRKQQWCCSASGLTHFDISYYAFESLAHPVYGLAMIQWRPVDCDTGAPLPDSYIDRSAIFSGGPRPGWSWQSYSASGAELRVPSAPTPAGTASTCITLSPGGGLQFKCRECYRPGFQPFAGARALAFWLRSNSPSADPFVSSTPLGQAPNLTLILKRAETGTYCKSEPRTSAITPTQAAAGGWFRFQVPLSAFDCPGGGVSLADVDELDLQNPNERNAVVCLGDMVIVR